MKTVIVTGGLGFIGSNLIKYLNKKKFFVVNIDKFSYASNYQNIPKNLNNYKFYKKDINDRISIRKILSKHKPLYIFNCAAETHVDRSIDGPKVFIKSNINGLFNLLEEIKYLNKTKLIHISTDEVYGDINLGNHKEHDILKPSNPYSATKACADMLILAWARTYNIPYVILRPTNNYGEGQYVEKLIPKCCKYVQLGRKLPLHNKGLSVRTWLHVKDTANAVIKIIESRIENEIFNVSSHFELKNIEVCDKIIDIYFPDSKDKSQFYDFSYQRPGEDLRYSLNDEKLRSLGWKEEAIFEEEIVEIAKYYRNRFIW